jgi:hypothetical protein
MVDRCRVRVEVQTEGSTKKAKCNRFTNFIIASEMTFGAQLLLRRKVQGVAFDSLVTMLKPVITHFHLILALMISASSPALAQGQPGPGSPPPPRFDRDGREGRDGRPFGSKGPFDAGPGGPGRGGPGRGDDFSQLNEAERQRVRAALEKAWRTPEVEAARDRLMKANHEFRETIRQVIEKDDTEAAKILSRIKPPTPWDVAKDRMRMPRPEDPHFADAAIGRLAMELHNFSKPEHREAARTLHAKVMDSTGMVEAVKQLRAAPPSERMAIFKAMADDYRKAVEKEVAHLRQKFRSPLPPPATDGERLKD